MQKDRDFLIYFRIKRAKRRILILNREKGLKRMEKMMMSAAGLAAGMVIAGTIGVLVNQGKIKPRKLAKKTAKAMNKVEDAMQNAARMTHKYC